MAAKKKTVKKQARSKRKAGKRPISARKPVKSKKPAKKTATPAKKSAKKKPGGKKPPVKAKVVRKKKTTRAKSADIRYEQRRQPFSRAGLGARSAGQSGDLQGLSDVEGADSESVDELIEEGNAFEADVVAGVQEADGADEQEVRTHEVSEDDVPEEYLEKD